MVKATVRAYRRARLLSRRVETSGVSKSWFDELKGKWLRIRNQGVCVRDWGTCHAMQRQGFPCREHLALPTALPHSANIASPPNANPEASK